MLIRNLSSSSGIQNSFVLRVENERPAKLCEGMNYEGFSGRHYALCCLLGENRVTIALEELAW